MNITVVIPAFNAEKTLGRALESVLGQTFPVREIIVVDDGSRDGTSGVIRAYQEKHPNIRCVSLVNRGPSAARNEGIALAACDWIAFLDSDDWWEDDKLAQQVRWLNDRPADLAYTAIRFHRISGEIVTKSLDLTTSPSELLRYVQPMVPSTVLVKRQILIEAGLFDPDLRRAEDWDLWARIAARGAVFLPIDIPLVHYIESEGSLSRTHLMLQAELSVLKKGYLLQGLGGHRRMLCKRMTRARMYQRAAFLDRERNHRIGEVWNFLRSIWDWPFPITGQQRYKPMAVSTLRLLAWLPLKDAA